jgi:hypothetical protein
MSSTTSIESTAVHSLFSQRYHGTRCAVPQYHTHFILGRRLLDRLERLDNAFFLGEQEGPHGLDDLL